MVAFRGLVAGLLEQSIGWRVRCPDPPWSNTAKRAPILAAKARGPAIRTKIHKRLMSAFLIPTTTLQSPPVLGSGLKFQDICQVMGGRDLKQNLAILVTDANMAGTAGLFH